MTSPTGSKPSGESGLTLIELLVATVVLSLGTLLIQEGLIRSAGLLSRFQAVLASEDWAGQSAWTVRDKLFYLKEGLTSESGIFEDEGRTYAWQIKAAPLGGSEHASRVTFETQWNEGSRPMRYAKTVLMAAERKDP